MAQDTPNRETPAFCGALTLDQALPFQVWIAVPPPPPDVR